MCDEILQLTDIAEVESERLAELLTLQEVEPLFLVEGVSYTAHYCGPHYLKFKTLIQVLTWSFSSIMEHFRMGALTDFSIHELVHLSKALFSDTPLRQRNIAEIQQGHPM
jgi:endonuclease/exonuclease/phosphatase family metal-dependent hydrolase